MNFPSMRVEDKIAVVTGTGSGLGRAIAIGLAHGGADVVLTELPERLKNAEETARQIADAGRKAFVVPLDVTDLPGIREMVNVVVAEFGRIDILINNAGINIPKLAVEVTEEDWDRVIDVDLKGVFFTAQAVASRAMIPMGAGKIVNIASQMGVVGYSHRAAYCAAKAGVVNLTRVLAFEWRKHEINVNAVAPTFVETPLTKPMFEDPAFKENVLARIPLGRLAKPEDIVGAVVYLSSAAADMVTGHTLLVDGGWTAI
jgi:2-deoxy-D-gluconate 3-dehydrogenase